MAPTVHHALQQTLPATKSPLAKRTMNMIRVMIGALLKIAPKPHIRLINVLTTELAYLALQMKQIYRFMLWKIVKSATP